MKSLTTLGLMCVCGTALASAGPVSVELSGILSPEVTTESLTVDAVGSFWTNLEYFLEGLGIVVVLDLALNDWQNTSASRGPSPIPEPAPILAVGVGLAGLCARRRR